MAKPTRGGSPQAGMSIEGKGLHDLQQKLKALDAKALRRELNKALRDASAPLIRQARDAAREELPRAGGLNERIAGAPMRVSVTSGKSPGIKIVVKGVDARAANRGVIRHPVYKQDDRPTVWVTQRIKPDWFTDRMRRKAPDVRPRLVEAMDEVAKKAARA